MKLKYAFLFLSSFLVCGCAMNDMATKDDITQVQGNLSEEMVNLKRNFSQLQMDLEETSQQNKAFKEGTNSNLNAFEKKLETLQGQISSLDQKILKIQTEQQQLQAYVQKTFQDQSKALQTQRNSDQVTTEKKLNIILEEVSKENNRLWQEIHRSSRTVSSSTPVHSADGDFYVVQPGESLSKIAARLGVSPQALAQANNITNPSSIRVGQKLVIPKKQS